MLTNAILVCFSVGAVEHVEQDGVAPEAKDNARERVRTGAGEVL